MKKMTLSVAVAAALGLTACGGDTVEEIAKDAPVVHPASRVSFDPGNAAGPVFPLPNDLAFSGTTDGTLNVSGERNLPAGQLPNYVDAGTAVGALDGWSTTTPFVIDIETRPGVTIDAATVGQPGVVRLFEAVLGNPTSPGDCATAPLLSACETGDELTFGVDFVTKLNGKQVVVVPLKPLKAKQGYLIALTNLVQDSNGNPIKGSTTYEGVRRDIKEFPLPLASQLSLQTLVNSYENGVASKGVDKDSLVYTGAFTTQSVLDVTETVKNLMLSGIPGTAPVLSSLTATGVNAAQALGLNPDAEGRVASAADVYKGSLTLPYYLDLPTPANCDLLANKCPSLNGRWVAKGDSPVTVSGALASGALSRESFAAQAVAQGKDPAELLANPKGLVGLEFTVDTPAGKIPVDRNRHLTKFNPLPKVKSLETVEVLSTLPNVDRINALRAAAAAQAGAPFTDDMKISKPATGWPVMMFAHGIPRKKEDVLAIAGAMANAGIATIAIDHPLHGARSIDFNGDGVFEISASDSFKGVLPAFANANVLAYMNLGSLLTARDNVRQSEADLLALRLALNGAASQAEFDITKISFLGYSLGGVTGTPFLALANAGVRNPVTGAVVQPNPYQVKAATLAMPGGGIVQLLLNSPQFGPVVRNGLIASDNFQDILVKAAPGVTTPEQLAALKENDPAAYQKLVEAALPAFLAQFTFAAQTLLDSGDAVNYAQTLAATNSAVHMIEVVGDGADNLSDQTVVNNVPTAPLSGTDPLVALMGLSKVTETTTAADGVSGVVRFSKGHHGSLLNPMPIDGQAPDAASTAAATKEMQTQVATFMASGGNQIKITDDSVIDND